MAAVVLGVLVLGGAVAAYGAIRYERAHEGRILPGVRIDGLDVGGMTRTQAREAVKRVAQEPLRVDTTISVGVERWVTTPSQLGRRANIGHAVDQALHAGGNLGTLDRAWHRMRNEPLNVDIPLTYSTKGHGVQDLVDQIAKAVAVAPQDAAIGIDENATDIVFHHAVPGQKLNASSATRAITAALAGQRRQVQLQTQAVEPKVTQATMGRTIVVRVDRNRLELYDGFSLERTYPVATAKPGFTTPDGVWRITGKQEWPTWYNPALDSWGAGEAAVVPGGPGNPMGARVFYLTAPDLTLLHGTNEESSIGRYASHGCIRMHNADVIALYPLVHPGEHVIIVGKRPANAAYWSLPPA